MRYLAKQTYFIIFYYFDILLFFLQSPVCKYRLGNSLDLRRHIAHYMTKSENTSPYIHMSEKVFTAL